LVGRQARGPASAWLSREAPFIADSQVRPTRKISAETQRGEEVASGHRVAGSLKPLKVLIRGIAIILAIAFFIATEREIVWIIGKVLSAIAGPLGDPE